MEYLEFFSLFLIVVVRLFLLDLMDFFFLKVFDVLKRGIYDLGIGNLKIILFFKYFVILVFW